MALTQYITDTQLLCHDTNGVFASQSSYISWINEARSWIAGKSMCVRELCIVPTVASQETYALPTGTTAGVTNALGVLSISVPWNGNLKPTLMRFPWTKFQAECRVFSSTTIGNPCVYAQYNDANFGQVYLYPIPQQAYNAEWDCWMNVEPLTTDTTPEAIPYPFTTAVKYYAAYLAFMNAQRIEDAKNMMQAFEMQIRGARANVTQTFLPSAYR